MTNSKDDWFGKATPRRRPRRQPIALPNADAWFEEAMPRPKSPEEEARDVEARHQEYLRDIEDAPF